jgi:small subunit ribosomal protein S7e
VSRRSTEEAQKKLVKKDKTAPSEVEAKVATELAALEAGSTGTWKTDLAGLSISKAVELELEGGRKAVVIFVPPPRLNDFRKVQKALVEELEKKMGQNTHVLLVANRTMVPPGLWQRSGVLSGVRPRSRTLKHVQDSLLDDLLFPVEISGKRTKVKMDGARLLKVLVAKKDESAIESKADTFVHVYKKLTNRDIAVEVV